MSRLIDTLARACDKALAAVNTARALVRATAWKLAGEHAPDDGIDAEHPLLIDLDATLLTRALGEGERGADIQAGIRVPPVVLVRRPRASGTDEPLAIMLRPGNAGSNTAADHIAVTRNALRQLPFTAKAGGSGGRCLIRTDAAGGTHEFVDKPPAWPTCPYTDSPTTGSGSRSPRSPWNSPPGRRPSPSPITKPAAGNPSACGYGCSPSPDASPATPAKSTYACPRTPPSPNCSSPPSSA